MAKYIKLDAIKARLEDLVGWCQDLRKPGLEQALAMLIEEPAADVAPVVHGRWEYTPQTFNTLGQIRCPFCAWWSLDQSIDGIYKYCPNCGAKMDGGDNDAAD